MNAEQVVGELQSLVDTGTRVPGFRRKVLVDIDRLVALGDELGRSIPASLLEAQEILKQKESILNQSYLEAQRIKTSAEDEAASLAATAQQEHEIKVDETEIIKVAEAKADKITDEAMMEAQQIVQDAQRRAYRLLSDSEEAVTSRREGADQYAREVLFNLEEQLAEVLGQVRRGIDALGVEADAQQAENHMPVA